ncbi:phage antirepressor KilAC domain-containing protein [Streptococcus hyointestinalis]|uniref:Prophage LambdaSa1, antirepressor n=1 Tax=Streptococcus hyointestinalis TaxID=1337 RepID=A0A380K7B0_9STRE|nr:phage antirepressor KilAC domain-containing protein [Streptococcus hyointestinalis]SUN60539.1 prophage LambdaSa1, antirepressor [Streptococcus hyointestinalis]
MNNLISVNLNENNEPVVSGRQLHKALEVKTPYDKWFPRMTDYGFAENEDFSTFLSESTGGRRATDHILKLDMAKEIAMLQRTDKGKEVRQYFIQVEKEFNSPDKIIARALLLSNDKVLKLESRVEFLETELEEAQKQARYLDLIIESKASLRVTQIAADYGMSAHKFNKLLHDLGVQHKVNGQWILYKKHMGKGYVDSATFDFIDGRGQARTHITTTWTQKGRLFLYELLKETGILPLIERDEDD